MMAAERRKLRLDANGGSRSLSAAASRDRKSTRLNSRHRQISYAVFCLKKKMQRMFGEYFAVFPWDSLPRNPVGFDAGCGSGRWAALVAPRVGWLHCIDASADALAVAQKRLAGLTNVEFHATPLDAMPLTDNGMDFGYSLGVLHHLPDPAAGPALCLRKLKRGAPMLVYIYYAFDNRPAWVRLLWRASDLLRDAPSQAPLRLESAGGGTLSALGL